jgi:uncharacterized protein
MSDQQSTLGEVKNNVEKRRFELVVEGKMAVAEYIDRGSMIVFTHTEVPVGLEGRGIGSHLVSHALDFARREGKTVMPLCPYVAAYIRRHPEYQSIVLEGFRY